MTGLREALAAFAAGVVRAADTSRDDYTLTPPATEHPMTEPTRAQLLHLAARARDERALPAEHDALAAGITAMADEISYLQQLSTEQGQALGRACTAREEQRTRAEKAEAAIERVRVWIAGEPVTARSEFGNGYREALRDITDALDQAQ